MNDLQHSPFKAIADPTRREIISLLVDAQSPLPITSITDRFPTTRQAVTKHIKVLHSAGLIHIRKSGRERYCLLNPKPLKEVYEWVASYQQHWGARIESLEKYFEQERHDHTVDYKRHPLAMM